MKKFWLACMILVTCRLLAAFILPTFDDAFITYRYACNLASGHGLVYNPGEKVMGTTAPLFAVLASIPAFLSVSVPRFFLFFNLLCDLGSLFLLYKYFFKGKTEALFFLFAALFAFDSMINRISIGGMEADLFLFVSLSGIVLYLNGRKTLAAALLAAAYFLRPEAVLLLGIVTIYEIVTTRKIPFMQGVVALLVLAIPLACIYAYYGQILPQSVIAKSTMNREPTLPLLKNIFFPDPLYILIFPLAVYGFFVSWRKDRIYLLPGIWVVSYGLAYLAKAPHAWSWYFFSIDTIQLVYACFGISALVGNVKPGWQVRPVYRSALAATPILAWIFVLIVKGRSGVEKNIYSELQKDFAGKAATGNAPAPPGGETIFFADDIGALGYFTHAYIYDNQMLVTPDAAKFTNTPDRVRHVNPDYLFFYTDSHYMELIRKDTTLSKRYSFVKRYAITGEKELPADLNSLGNEYKQDYMLFKRNP